MRNGAPESSTLSRVSDELLESGPDGIVLADEKGRIVLVNAETEKLFGYERDELLGQSVELLLPQRLRSRHVRHRADYLAEPRTRPMGAGFDLFGRRKDGSEFPVDISLSALTTEPGTLVTAFIRDVTERKATEAAAERLRSDLLATVSHQLRTPLAGVLGLAELLVRRKLDAATRRAYTETIYSEAQRLSELVTSMLDLQRIEQGHFEPVLEPFDLGELLCRKVDVFSGQSEAHSLALSLPAERVTVGADREQLGHVIGNLLSNAIKYSPGGGRVEVRLRKTSGAVRVSVRDHGIGIPPAQEEYVFEKFSRVDSAEVRQIRGSGLGLALAKGIVEAHGGRIGLRSARGKGSTFWFELPASTAGRSGLTTRSSSAPPGLAG